MNQQLFWEEIKTVLGEIIREKIGNGNLACFGHAFDTVMNAACSEITLMYLYTLHAVLHFIRFKNIKKHHLSTSFDFVCIRHISQIPYILLYSIVYIGKALNCYITSGEDLQNPHKFSELLENKEPEKTFKDQVESMMEKLKSMESTKPSPENFDKLMESLVSAEC